MILLKSPSGAYMNVYNDYEAKRAKARGWVVVEPVVEAVMEPVVEAPKRKAAKKAK